MPGIIGFFSGNDQERSHDPREKFNLHCEGLDPQAGFEDLARGPRHRFSVVMRQTGPRAVSSHESDSSFCAVYGHCLDRRSGESLNAESWSAAWQAEGKGLLDHLEGAFHVVHYDRSRETLRVLNDRVGILPLYWHWEPSFFSFGPRLRHLVKSAAEWDPNPGAVVNFLSVGHFLGPNTQARQANFLTPATILEIDTREWRLKQERYWNLVYEADESLSDDQHCQRLGNVIGEAVDLLTKPAAGRPGIFLSGGWDSRSLLGASLKLGRPPHMCITNGVSDQIRFADTWMARKLTQDLKLPYRFCRRIPDAGPDKWLDGIRRGEITTANNPENFGNHQLSPDTFAELDYILKGDVTWGSGDSAPTRDLSIGKIIPYPLMDKVKSVLQPDVAALADDLYEEQIDSVLQYCQNTDWTDRRDYLWQMGGINRYILGLGISDEEHIQVRRPLLCGSVFDVYTQVPRRLRVLKNLFIQSIHDFYPDLFAYGRNHTSNIAYYYAYMAEFVRERTREHLLAGHDLHGLLDRTACLKVIDAFRPVEGGVWIPGLKTQLYNRLHDRFSYKFHRTRFYREKKAKNFATSDTMLAFHIYLLLEWFHGTRDHEA